MCTCRVALTRSRRPSVPEGMPVRDEENKIMLASGSADRRELLMEIFPGLVIRAANVDESPLPGESVPDQVLRLARAKGRVVARSARVSGQG